ncbi:alpha/beta fold hydrolase [uncultured Maritimibacter sp.]|jgi:3-oxoadipate enol-lactonase|uniref:alpha/beta fold hydrolase n=1 Tax=uncultured Maritimibacter sp. TaxID=991866 RepID=UPI002603AD69|nr:alpha/beta fold hydrolase [uncultured Maritimibacter sp.]
MQVETTDGVTLSVTVTGDDTAPALVFANPLGTDQRFWEAQAASFPDRRVIRFDHAGTGGSTERSATATLPRTALDVIDILDALEVETADYVGLSLGGLVGMELGAAHGDRLGRLVLAHTTPHIPLVNMWNGRIAQAKAEGLANIAPPTLARWLPDGFADDRPDDYARLVTMFTETPVKGYVACCTLLRDSDMRGALASIRNETLILQGALDQAVPAAVAQSMAEAIPDAHLVTLPDAAHLSNIERPEAFNAALRQFLTTGA